MGQPKKKFHFRGKQILLFGLVALVLTAGYYRWNMEKENFASVPVAGDALPANADQQNSEAQKQDDQGNQEGQEQSQQEQGSSQTIAQLKQERDTARSEAVEQWQQTAKNGDSSGESKSDAEKRIKQAAENAEKEKSIETLVKAKGFADCFAHVDDAGVSVMVSGGEVNGAKVAQVKDIVVAETNIPVRNIKISAE